MIVTKYSLKKSIFGAEMVQDEHGPWANHDEVLKDLGSEVAAANKSKLSREQEVASQQKLGNQMMRIQTLEKELAAKHDKWDEERKQKEALDEIATNTQNLLNAEKVSTEQFRTEAVKALEAAGREVKLADQQTKLAKINIEALELTITQQAERINDLEVDRTDEMAEADGAKLEKTEAEAEVQTQAAVIVELQDLLEKAVTQLQEADVKAADLTAQLDRVKQGAAESLVAIPNLKPIVEMMDLADPSKSVQQLWAEAMWPKLSPELKAEILLAYAQSLTDPELIRQQMEMVRSLQADISSASETQKPAASNTEAPENGASLPDLNGTNTNPKD